METLLLFAQANADMLQYPCSDLAAAAALISLRLQASPASLCIMCSESAQGCAQRLWSVLQSHQAVGTLDKYEGGGAAAAV